MHDANVRPVDMIMEKRNGSEHAPERLEAFMNGYLAGEVPDYQVAAWLMAVCWRGMTDRETAELTRILTSSGSELDLSDLPHTVDKHATGGVGDKTTLVLAPMLAAAGATVAKMSGRSLGHTGGTVDKLESIPGFRGGISKDAFMRQAHEVGIVVAGHSRELAPAEGLLYALRDTTGTVRSPPLIASSIMSKKLAGGAQSIVLDVKVGTGTFMRTPAEGRALAETMVAIGRHAGRNMRAVLSSMSQPLGLAVGNALEVREALACLRGEGPADVLELCLALAGEVLDATGLPSSEAQLRALVDGGQALERFQRWIAAQGGDVTTLDRLELAPDQTLVRSRTDGVLAEANALAVGRAAFALGAGRGRIGESVDPGVGVVLHAKVGRRVRAGEGLATLYHRGGNGLEEATRLLEDGLRVSDKAPPMPTILEKALA